MTRKLPTALAVLLLGAPVCSSPARGMDESIVFETPLDRLEAAVREQILTARLEVRELEDAAAPAEERGTAWGRLGGLYYLYELHDAASASLARAEELDPDEAAWPYLAALAAEGNGDLERAAEGLERALGIRPEYVPALVRLGRLELERNRAEDAEARFRAALALHPESAAAEAGLGEVARLRGQPEKARDHFERALSLQPAANALHYPLGLVYRELGDLDRAREHLAARGPDDPVEPDPILDSLARAGRGASPHIERGNRAMTEESWDEAAGHYRRALEEDPENLRALLALASALARGGHATEAMEEYRRILDRDPDNPTSRYNYGLLLAEADRLEEAAEQLGAAVTAAPDFANGFFNLALVLERLGRPGEAAEAMARAAEAAPEDPEPPLERARLLAALGDREQAQGVLENLLATRDLNAAHLGRTHRLLATIHGRSGRFGEAAAAYEAAIEAQGASEELRFGQVTALLLAGDDPGARRVLELAVEELPESLALRHLLARVLATSADPEVRDPARALELAREVLAVSPRADHGETVAMALAAAGRFDDAAAWQRTMLEEARRRGRTDLVERLSRNLTRYERNEPVIAPWRE